MNISSRNQLLWVSGAGVLGLACSAIFSGLLHWNRTGFVLAYGVLVTAFLIAYFRLNGIRLLTQIRRRWVSGAVVGTLAGLVLARNVSGQPGSAPPSGAELAGALVWFGLVYGSVDALLLNIVPVLSLYGMRPRDELGQLRRRLYWGLVAVAGSLLITALYHLGFTEFRGPALVQPLVGNTIITGAYLLAGNPLAALIAHVLMHIAAVIHGMHTTVQLPPHY
jgi:hypothetical protein